jgi:hypothetical protein
MRSAIALGASLLLAGALATAAEKKVVEAARELVKKHQDAVVLVEVVLKVKLSRGGQSRDTERKMELNGTVIKESGLTVISNGSLDPYAQYRRMGVKVDTTTSSVKIIQADGTEHEAKVVLTDKDLDLAFVRPDKTDLKLPFVDLKNSAEPKMFDDLVSLTRMDRKSGRAVAAAVSRVLSVVKKPQTYFVASGSIFASCPVFTGEGKVAGLALRRQGAGSLGVLPCEDILDIVTDIKPPKKKTGDEDGDGDGEKKDPEAKKEEKKPKEGGIVEEQLPPVMKGGK